MKRARIFILTLMLALAPAAARAQGGDPSGDWRGALAVGPVQLRVAMHLGATSTFDSPDQGAMGLPSRMSVDGSHVRVEVNGIGAFDGELSEDGAHLNGHWIQGANTLPLSFERGLLAAAVRPQTPVPPFPYRSEEVVTPRICAARR